GPPCAPRACAGRPFGAALAVRDSVKYAGRYVLLAVIVGAVLFIFALPSLLGGSGTFEVDAAYVIPTVMGLLALDFLGTFVTPALAFTTRSPDKAIRIGLSLLRRT